MVDNTSSRSNAVRAVGRIANVVGAAGSVALVLWAGQRNRSAVLMLVFTLWVLSPFIALASATRLARAWVIPTRHMFEWLGIAVALVSISVYSYTALYPPKVSAAAAFVVTPPLLVAIIVVCLILAKATSRREP